MGKIALLVNGEFRQRIFNEKYYAKIRNFGDLKIFDKENFEDTEYVLDFVKGAEVIITSWSSPKLDKAILDACPDLKGVIHAAGTIKPLLTDEYLERKIYIGKK